MINSKLILVGTGQEEHNLKDKAKFLSNVIFIVPLDHSKILEIMNCADVLALCSLREGMPTVVLEAMACGLPVVFIDVGDVGKIVKNDFSQNCINIAEEYSI